MCAELLREQDIQRYKFELVPYWIRVYNIPMNCMGRQLALEVGGCSEGGLGHRLEGQG